MLLDGLAAGVGIAIFALVYRWRPLTVEKQIWIVLGTVIVASAFVIAYMALVAYR